MERLRSSICFPCCFRGPDVDPLSPSWVRSKAGECLGLLSRSVRNRRRQPGDFKYDPLSYALNFDEGPDFDDDVEVSAAEHRFRSFSARLPASPPTRSPTALISEEVVCS